MQLESVRVQNYRCIDDSGWVSIDNVACFIGRNESGKTSILEAVGSLNPEYDGAKYNPYEDYPRQDWREYDADDADSPVVVKAKFSLEGADLDAVEETFREDILASDSLVVSRDYENEYHWDLDVDEGVALDYVAEEYDLDDEVESAARDADAVADLSTGDGADARTALADALGDDPITALSDEIGDGVLADRLPVFRYIGEHATLEGAIEIEPFLDRREKGELDPSDRAFLSLLQVADLDVSALDSVEDWREVTAELEAASASLSEDAMQYWSQSGDISIRLQHATTEDGDTVLDLRVENHKHNVTVEFDQRSLGFRRFFSTFCQLSALQEREADLVVIIDEPAQNLHVRAQEEFLDFISTEIATQHPVLYTTHSPFMIDPQRAHETKMVMSDPVGETNVFTDVTLADRVTRFPLRTVFESDLMDTVLVTPHALAVEEKADHIYLSVLSALVEEEGTDGLDSRWTVVPVRTHENITTFEGLFGEDRLDIAALLSTDPRQTAGRREDNDDDISVTVVSEYTSYDDGTIEDLFTESFYLTLVNRAYASSIGADGTADRLSVEDIGRTGAIVARLGSYFAEHDIAGGSFDRHKPALYLQENRDELADELDSGSIRAFARVFRDLNRTLTSFEGVESGRSSLLDIFR